MEWSLKKITQSVSKAIGILYKLKHILTKKTLFMLYNALVFPHITYCNIVWGNSNRYNLDSVLLLQKKALRMCTHSNNLAHTDPIFYNKNLKVNDIHTYQTQNLLPFFHNIFTRVTVTVTRHPHVTALLSIIAIYKGSNLLRTRQAQTLAHAHTPP